VSQFARRVDRETAALRGGRRRSSLDDARERATLAMARLRELTLDVQEGRLVPVEQVRREAFTWARRVREACLAWPGQIGGEVAATLKVDGPTLIVALEAHVHALLEQLADEPVPSLNGGQRVQRGRARRPAA
jgi:hypothetical protein